MLPAHEIHRVVHVLAMYTVESSATHRLPETHPAPFADVDEKQAFGENQTTTSEPAPLMQNPPTGRSENRESSGYTCN